MGSKRSMLANGLGTILKEEGRGASRFVDLFCGSGAVSWYAAENLQCPVLAVDIQEYAVALARSVVTRTRKCDLAALSDWLSESVSDLENSPLWTEAAGLRGCGRPIQEIVSLSRDLCADTSSSGPIWRAYGGHYYAPWQALTIDCLLGALPMEPEKRSVALAATIHAASKCVAAPGHTAQPLQPTETAATFLMEAWSRDPLDYVVKAIQEIGPRRAQRRGIAMVGDAEEVSASLGDSDLVFADPPYSNVQYSRFYHVLETVARGTCGPVDGAGRYPASHERPRSVYSLRSQAQHAIYRLLRTLAEKGCTVVLTFLLGQASNGLSGNEIANMAREWYKVSDYAVKSNLSTLGGGNNGNREARQLRTEVILVLRR